MVSFINFSEIREKLDILIFKIWRENGFCTKWPDASYGQNDDHKDKGDKKSPCVAAEYESPVVFFHGVPPSGMTQL